MTPPLHDMDPALANLLARVTTFLDDSEAALARNEPQAIAQSASDWARLGRELRLTQPSQWPDPAVRAVMLGQLATRVSALRQAIGRAQVRTDRELSALMGSSGAETAPASSDGAPVANPLLALRPTYNAAGGRVEGLRFSGTYA